MRHSLRLWSLICALGWGTAVNVAVNAQHQHHPSTPAVASKALPLKVKGARAVAVPPGIRETSVFGTLTNSSAQPVTLTQVQAEVAGHAMLMLTERQNGLLSMRMVEQLTLPAKGQLILSETGPHLMLMELKRALKVGEMLKITLQTADGRTFSFTAVVKKP